MDALVRPDGLPLYAQIRKSPQDDIAKNILISRQKLHSEDKLAIQLGVCRLTEPQAISGVIGEGLLCRLHRIDTFLTREHSEQDALTAGIDFP